jgi:hypothetical protein
MQDEPAQPSSQHITLAFFYDELSHVVGKETTDCWLQIVTDTALSTLANRSYETKNDGASEQVTPLSIASAPTVQSRPSIEKIFPIKGTGTLSNIAADGINESLTDEIFCKRKRMNKLVRSFKLMKRSTIAPNMEVSEHGNDVQMSKIG